VRAEARVVYTYRDEKTAELMARLLELDNSFASRDLQVETHLRGMDVETLVRHQNLNTLLNTIDDLVFSEKLISSLLED
jgi:hypothetical protein